MDARLAGGPAAPRGGLVPAVQPAWLGLVWVRQGSWRGIADALVRDWAHGSWPLTHLDLTRAFLQVSLVAIPAGLALGALAWWWRNYAVSSGIGGWLASAPITFDARQWKRQVHGPAK